MSTNRPLFLFLLVVSIVTIFGLFYQFSPTFYSFGEIGVTTKSDRVVTLSTSLEGMYSREGSARLYQSLVFVGDVLLARNVEYLMRYKNPEYPFSGVTFSSLAEAPAVIGNFEASVPREHEPTPLGQLKFSVFHRFLTPAQSAGFTHFSLANNHSFDFGSVGYEDTLLSVAEKFTPFGHPNGVTEDNVAYLMIENKKVALVGINAIHEPFDFAEVQRTLPMVTTNSDVQIVYIHWGDEYAEMHNRSQQQIAEMLVALGVDLIIGHHPHVIQGVDLIDSVPVFYSLGNYIFDQYFSIAVQTGLLLKVTFTPTLNIALLPVSSQAALSQPQLLLNEERRNSLQSIANKSHPDLQKSIAHGMVTLPLLETAENNIAYQP